MFVASRLAELAGRHPRTGLKRCAKVLGMFIAYFEGDIDATARSGFKGDRLSGIILPPS